MADTFDKHADQFDIRDVIARFEELEDLKDTGAPDDFTAEEHEEFLILLSFLEEVKGYGGDEQWRGDWYPLGFIHEDYFVEAMEELVKDIGDLPKEIPSYIAIDWNATAENLRVDYSSVDIDGETFWYR